MPYGTERTPLKQIKMKKEELAEKIFVVQIKTISLRLFLWALN